jgi:predicted restriction endonuclease
VSTRRREWNYQEQLLALRLYNYLPFGQLHDRHIDIIRVAESIGRTPAAVAMKASNFASLDSNLDRKGLSNVSNADRLLWQTFMENSESIANEAEQAYQQLIDSKQRLKRELANEAADQLTESTQLVKVRRVQSFFRKTVLVSYGEQCAITGLSNRKLLIASHIIPWKDNEKRRADPTNGIALNALHDKLFDQGLMTFDESLRVVMSKIIKKDQSISSKYQGFLAIEGEKLMLPERYRPDPEAINYHRENVFVDQYI